MSDDFISTAIEETIKECDTHIVRIESALNVLKNTLPLTIEKYSVLNEEEVRALDQFIYRYTKLQDKIGSSLLKNICASIEYSNDARTFIDILAILEKHSYIQSARKWQELRSLRNRFTHEYPENIDMQIEIINEVVDAYTYVLDEYQNLCKKAGYLKENPQML